MINNKNTLSVEIINIPILIVGTGIGGLSTAYYLTKYNLDYLILNFANKLH